MQSSSADPPLPLPLGEPSGIGAEITLSPGVSCVEETVPSSCCMMCETSVARRSGKCGRGRRGGGHQPDPEVRARRRRIRLSRTTEFLEDLAGPGWRATMVLASGQLRVVPVSINESLAKAVSGISLDRIVESAEAAHAGLRRDFGIERPRLAIAGINPTAGKGEAWAARQSTS